jgi:RNA polymerase sigma factor (sigma-70 family)
MRIGSERQSMTDPSVGKSLGTARSDEGPPAGQPPDEAPDPLARDRALHKRVCAGDADAIVELFREQCGPRIKDISRRRRIDFEDLLQETILVSFLGDWCVLRRWRGDDPLRSYVCGIAWKLCSLLRRREGPLKVVQGLDPDSQPSRPSSSRLEEVEGRLATVMAVIESLPDREKQVLREWLDGRTARQAAENLDISEVYARVLKHRALNNLRQQLRKDRDDV